MKRAAVIGHPIAQSKSPVIHRFWLQQLGLEGDYQRIDVSPDELNEFMHGLAGSGYAGVNVTLPHKIRVAHYCDHLTPLATRVGAVNTVVVEADGRLLGHNSDVAGFTTPLFKMGDFKGQKACVLGAGGAARAIVAGLASLGVAEIHVVNRHVANIKSLTSIAPVLPHDWSDVTAALSDAALLVNATSLGMIGQPPMSLDLSPLATDAIVDDIVYAPLETELLRQAKARGLRTIDGLEMLMAQAAEAFDYFFGFKPDRTRDGELRALLTS
jgi:shikimate dehydrogenase